MTMNPGNLTVDNTHLSHDHHEDSSDENHFAVKMAGQIRASQKRRKIRAQRTRSRRR